MASDGKRNQDPEVEPQLQEVEVAQLPDPAELLRRVPTTPSIEIQMERVTDDFRSLPTPAQLAILRIIVPELISDLDAFERPKVKEEIVGEQQPGQDKA